MLTPGRVHVERAVGVGTGDPRRHADPRAVPLIPSIAWWPVRTIELDDAGIDEIVGEPDDGDGPLSQVVATITGRPARTFAQWVGENADAFRPRTQDVAAN